MLELIDICFEKDNKKILNNINLKIDDKSFIAITGPNGSGKSTLAKIIMGIEKPNSGKILFSSPPERELFNSRFKYSSAHIPTFLKT